MKSLAQRRAWLVAVVLVFVLVAIPPANAAPMAITLTSGDIAIVGYNADDPDQFAFVLLANISAGTQINFTDNGWLASGAFRTGEGTMTWTAPTDLCAGTIIDPGVSSMQFATAGDQVLAYQGTASSPTFLYALNNEGAGVWQADATNANTSALPPGLTNGTTAVALDEIDNAVYNGAVTSGTRASLLSAISNKANWSGNDTVRQTMPTGPFTVTDAPPCGGDAAPYVSSTSPTSGASNVATNADIGVTFSEAVTVSGAWYDISCIYSGAHSATVSGGPTTYTLNPSVDFVLGERCTVTIYASQVIDQDGTPDNMAANYSWNFDTVAPTNTCGDPANPIYAIQGSGASSPALGIAQTIEGVVVGDFQRITGNNRLSGFFVQQESTDGNPATSDGIFVYEGATSLLDVAVGNKVRLRGTVTEYADRTVGGGTFTEISSLSSLQQCGAGSVTATAVTLPEPANGDLERYEGMLVSIASPMTVAQDYFVGRYGQMTLSSGGRMYQPTNQFAPGSAQAIASADENARRTLILDDGMAVERCGDNPNPAPYLGGPPPAVIRAGDGVSNLVGVLDYGQIDSGETGGCNDPTALFTGDYRLHPTQSPVFTAQNPRSDTPPTVGGNLKVVSANALNFFNGDGNKGGFPTSRGASTFAEFVRQRIKFYEELSKLSADVVGLAEIENDGFGSTSAIAELVKVLNEGPCWNSASECAALSYSNSGLGAGVYAFVNPGLSPVGSDEITVGIIYKPGRVTPVGAAAVLTIAAFTDPRNSGGQRNRPAIAQTFEENTWGERFTVAANHLKSKGSSCGAGDDDTTTGQGNCNGTRTDAAYYQVNTWLPADPTGAGDPDFLVIGDMNAYAKEDPISQYLNAGYTNLTGQYDGSTAYSYIFDGQSGYLDHALSNSSLTSQVAGASHWHINADEPAVIDYNTEFNPSGYYAPNQYRSADHDPALVGLGLYPDQSDLAGSYGLAWHTGQGTPWRLGTTWSGEASGGAGTDTDDGVTRNYSESWNDTRGEVYVTVTGPAGKWACLNAWLDYSDGAVVAGTPDTPNNAFDANEHVVTNLPIQPGAAQLVTWPMESGVMDSAVLYSMRFRLAPAPNPNVQDCSGVTLAALAPSGAAQPTGRADGGEVEDHTFSSGPLAATLATFTAQAQADHVLLTWETVSEVDNIGFDVLRSARADGAPIRLAFVAASTPGGATGASYHYRDSCVVAGATYWYWLEDVALDGARTLHGPVSVTFDGPTAVTLSDLSADGSRISAPALPLAVALSILGLVAGISR